MNIGSLYNVKEWHWLLFPTRKTARRPPAPSADFTLAVAAYFSKEFRCEVTYFSHDSVVLFLEEDGEYKKVLTSDGRIGWTWFEERFNDCFEEMKAE